MSAIDLTRRRFGVKAATKHRDMISREQEFRLALERCISDYEKHHAKTEEIGYCHVRQVLTILEPTWPVVENAKPLEFLKPLHSHLSLLTSKTRERDNAS